MALAIAEPFNYPVDLTLYPDYMLEIEYPMDFSLVKSRKIKHHFLQIKSADLVIFVIKEPFKKCPDPTRNYV